MQKYKKWAKHESLDEEDNGKAGKLKPDVIEGLCGLKGVYIRLWCLV